LAPEVINTRTNGLMPFTWSDLDNGFAPDNTDPHSGTATPQVLANNVMLRR
jgi:hypothetical protein